ncbi:DUF4435 domain-containing protein [Pseudomonas alliivorans]|nr:DUF4435 domain-containing protein [Pseudomonas alliivorans]
MLKWPQKSLKAIVKLFEPLQDIDVYVEDVNDEVFYKKLLEVAAQGKVRVGRVFAVGNRIKVLSSAQNHRPSKRRSLFIIDGDLEWVKGQNPVRLPWVYRHEAYCIENYLLCKKSAAELLAEELVLDSSLAQQKLDFDSWLSSVERPLVELFAAYATVHNFFPAYRTVSAGVGVLCTESGKKTNLDLAKVEAAKRAALEAAEKVADETDVSDYYARCIARAESLPEASRFISGKDFLIPLLDFHLQNFGCRIKRKVLRLRLAGKCDHSRLRDLQYAMLTYAG